MVAKLLTHPTVHLNGTSRAALARTYLDALSAIRTAQRMLDESAPNARDYYVQRDPNAFAQASAEHRERAVKLLIVRNELESLYDRLTDSEG